MQDSVQSPRCRRWLAPPQAGHQPSANFIHHEIMAHGSSSSSSHARTHCLRLLSQLLDGQPLQLEAQVERALLDHLPQHAAHAALSTTVPPPPQALRFISQTMGDGLASVSVPVPPPPPPPPPLSSSSPSSSSSPLTNAVSAPFGSPSAPASRNRAEHASAAAATAAACLRGHTDHRQQRPRQKTASADCWLGKPAIAHD
jgi:hypothetical protein